MDEVLTEEVASQQQTLAVAEGPLQDMTVTCKQCEATFEFTKGEQLFFQGKNMTQPAQSISGGANATVAASVAS